MTSFSIDLKPMDTYDVVVVGGGPSGCTAAIAVAREGKKTLLVEATGALGGMGTMGLVPAWCPFSDHEKIIYRGLAEKIFRLSKAFVPSEPEDKLDWVAIQSEELKRIYDDLVQEAGVSVLFNTLLCGAKAEDGRVDTLLLANKEGLVACRGTVYIDCSGDADLSVFAGAGFEKGDASGTVQPSTLCFVLGNVDTYAYQYTLKDRMRNINLDDDCVCVRMMKDPELDLIVDTHFCNTMIAPGAVGFNAGHLFDVDATDPMQVSKALQQGRKLAHQMLKGLKKYAPEAFANAYLAQTAPLMGIRESRRVICDYRLTVSDYLERRSFPDEIGRNAYYIDIHHSLSELSAVKDGFFDPTQRYEHYGPGESHGIPYRCLTPKGLKNCLVAGRIIGSDPIVFGSIRVMPACLVTGEAAGLAAALAFDQEVVDVHAINVHLLQERLISYGGYLHKDQDESNSLG
ncbi:MAG: FAD-dependent oxidoreductase [Clostridia bacterium]|nr:FAD-dependent oxidoreductase [Clostridia bacterium]